MKYKLKSSLKFPKNIFARSLLLTAFMALSAVGAKAETSLFSSLDQVSAEDLSTMSGASGINPQMLTTAQLSAVNVGNTVTNSVTGGNYISDNAFMGGSGIINIVQNSGNDVVIQNATTINLSMQ